MSELKPCPFCGAEATIKGGLEAQENYSAWCQEGHHLEGGYDREVLVQRWNQRAGDGAEGANPIGFPLALRRAKMVFEAYREDFPKWGKRLDGTPAQNDLPVRVAQAFSDLYPHPAAKVPEASKNAGAVAHQLREIANSMERGYSVEATDADAMQVLDAAARMLTTPQQSGEWVRCEDRLPTESDGWVWIYDPDPRGGVMGPFEWEVVDPADGETHWMPTGLKRPRPPQQEGE